ncbi:MAG TPA: hypothetical protein VGE55_04210 [Limnobacter sp.]|uniref:hypothetical protein n=1 Tax=Limnobacter sp. TaxID=2003368 RepID=UPI002ED79B61
MSSDGLGDWRIAVVTTLAEDIPPAYFGGPSHKKGAGVYLTTATESEAHGKLSFITPHPSALSFNIAFENSREAKKLQSRLARIEVVAPGGPAQAIQMQNIPFLYDYFEQAMVVVTFSFQAIEAFVNNEIVHNAKGDIRIKRKGKLHVYTPIDAERALSTEEKVAIVLPDILKIPTPRGKTPWEGFKKLKKARDATMHLKNKDVHQLSGSESLFIDLLVDDPEQYPLYAFELVNWFYKGREKPRWFQLLADQRNLV